MPTLSTSHYRRAVQPGVRGTGVIKANSLDYTENLVAADVALFRTQLLEAGIDWLDSVSYDAANVRFTGHFVSGRQVSFHLQGTTTRRLYYGGSTTVPSAFAQADLDAVNLVEDLADSTLNMGFNAPAGADASTVWYAFVLASLPQSITAIGQVGTVPTTVPSDWLPTPPRVTINGVIYNLYYQQQTGSSNVTMVVVFDDGVP